MIIEILLSILFTLLLVALLVVKPNSLKAITFTFVEKLTGKYENEVHIGKNTAESAGNLVKVLNNKK